MSVLAIKESSESLRCTQRKRKTSNYKKNLFNVHSPSRENFLNMKVALLIVVAVCAFSGANAAKGGPLASICRACKGGGGRGPPPVPATLFRDRFNMDQLLTKFDTEEDHKLNPGNIIKKLQAIVNAIKETVDDIVKEFVIPAVMGQVCQVCKFIRKIPPPPTLPPLPTAFPTLPPFPTNLPTFPPFPTFSPKSARD